MALLSEGTSLLLFVCNKPAGKVCVSVGGGGHLCTEWISIDKWLHVREAPVTAKMQGQSAPLKATKGGQLQTVRCNIL